MTTNFRPLGPNSRLFFVSRSNLQTTTDIAGPDGLIVDDDRVLQVTPDQEVTGFCYTNPEYAAFSLGWRVNARDSQGYDFMQNENDFVDANSVAAWGEKVFYMPRPLQKASYRYLFRFQKRGTDPQPIFWSMMTLQPWTVDFLLDPGYWKEFHLNKTPWFHEFEFTLPAGSTLQEIQPIFVNRDTFITGIRPEAFPFAAGATSSTNVRIDIRSSAQSTGPGLMSHPIHVDSISTTQRTAFQFPDSAFNRFWPGAYYIAKGSTLNIAIHRANVAGNITRRISLFGWQF